jgi:hypothetical protein
MIRVLLTAGCAFCLTFAAGRASLWAQPGPAQQRPVQQDLIDKVLIAPRAEAGAPAESRNVTTMRLLRSKAEFKIEIMSLENFPRFLSERYKIPVRIDPSGLERAGVARSAPISADISAMPLSAALRQILGRLNLDYRVVNGAIVISDRRPDRPVRRNPGRVVLHNGQAIIMQQGVGAANVGPALREQALRQLGPLIDVEFVFAKRIAKPDKDQLPAMRHDLQDFVKDQVNDFFDLMQGRVARTGGAFHLARKMLDQRLASFIDNHLSKDRADVYRQEVEKRDANERAVCALNLVVLLDRELSLTAKQRDAIQRALLENWDDGWSQVVEVGAMRGQSYLPSIPDELIENLLDSTQIEVWEGMQKIGSANWGFQVFRLGWFGMPVDELDKD